MASNNLVLPILIRPILIEFERKKDEDAARTIRNAFSRAEMQHPGFAYDFIINLISKADINANINEVLLRSFSDPELIEHRISRTEDIFQELNKKSMSLKKILSRIPEEISDRKTFLETIKEIASAIKKLLDAVNEIINFIPTVAERNAVEYRKKEFVKYSKKFSTTLKEYFKDGAPNAVFVSALYLIHQTNQITLSVIKNCE